jgi:hypothetical protein
VKSVKGKDVEFLEYDNERLGSKVRLSFVIGN